jgi:hypothetical protein
MKKSLLIIVLILFAKIILSQNTLSNYSLKLSNQFLKEKYKIDYQFDSINVKSYTNSDVSIFHPTFAIQLFDKKKNVHELELIDFYFNTDKGYQEIREYKTGNTYGKYYVARKVKLNLSIKYEYILIAKMFKEKKLKPSIGFGISPYVKSENQLLNSISNFQISETKIGIRTFFTPRLIYNFSERFFIDINTPFTLASIYLVSTKRNNPSLPINQRSISSFNFESFQKYWSGRIGIGLRI